ncbi:MAG: hypothetical protein AAF961_00625, partial [Planctomycetota bacterium]
VIERAEMATAATRLMQRDQDQDQCVGFDEIKPPADMASSEIAGASGSLTQISARPTRASYSELLRDAQEPLLPRRLLRKYDRNGDGRLSLEELRWSAPRVGEIDANADGALSVNELRRLANAAPDLSLVVELQPDDPGESTLQDDHVDDSPLRMRPSSVIRMRIRDAKVSFSYRDADPIAEATAMALRRFNQLDMDGSGHLDAEEGKYDVQLRRGLFDMIDANADDKVTVDEIESYVRSRGEPDAMTCRVCIHDTGSGIFQALDHNNDGRLSQRELRSAERSLVALERDRREGLTLEEPAKSFHIEFSRGGLELFGPSERNSGELPAFNRGSHAGPVWFQRMDRNNDGDLTWREFLGHREDFHRIDVDGDGLIDPQEAAAEKDENEN